MDSWLQVNKTRLLRVGSEQMIVVDAGSACLRAGVGGEEVPRVVQSMSGRCAEVHRSIVQ